MASAELQKHGKTERADKLLKFLKAYTPPRWRSSITKTTNNVPVYRVFIGGATESTIDVTIPDFHTALKAIETQMYEEAYKTFAQIVGKILMELAELGIVDEKPPSLMFSFEHLTHPLEAEDEESESSEDEESA